MLGVLGVLGERFFFFFLPRRARSTRRTRRRDVEVIGLWVGAEGVICQGETNNMEELDDVVSRVLGDFEVPGE